MKRNEVRVRVQAVKLEEFRRHILSVSREDKIDKNLQMTSRNRHPFYVAISKKKFQTRGFVVEGSNEKEKVYV